MDGILAYLKDGILPDGYAESTTMKRRANGFALVKGELFKKAFKKPLLKCVTPERGKKILDDLHQGQCGAHIGGWVLAEKPSDKGTSGRPCKLIPSIWSRGAISVIALGS